MGAAAGGSLNHDADGGEQVTDTSGSLLDLMVAIHEEKVWTTDELLAHSMTCTYHYNISLCCMLRDQHYIFKVPFPSVLYTYIYTYMYVCKQS